MTQPHYQFPLHSECVAAEIIECFEDLLEKHNIIIPDEDRTGTEDEAPIYGCTYGDLLGEIASIIRDYFNCDE